MKIKDNFDKVFSLWAFAGALLGTCFLLSVATGMEGYSSGVSGGIPAGSIVMTLSGTCPALYVESTQFRGRVAAGMPAGGTIGGTIGTPMTNLEPRLPAIIGQGGTIAAGSFLDGFTACVTCAVINTHNGSTLDATTPNSEPALPYVQVLYCVKS